MKKILTIVFAGALLIMTSCQKETINPTSTDNTTQQTSPPDSTATTTDPDTTSTNTNTNNPPSNLTLLQYLKGESDCSIFYKAVLRTGIEVDLSGDGPFTIFVPNDEAFQAFLENNNWTSLDDISQNILTMIVKFHLTNVEVKVSELEVGTIVSLFLIEKEMYINMDDPANPFLVLGLTKANFVERDLEQLNGIVHKIDGVLAL
ncbi:MAG: fasciclin domain-containing protein [Saprospiraceae bacterium]